MQEESIPYEQWAMQFMFEACAGGVRRGDWPAHDIDTVLVSPRHLKTVAARGWEPCCSLRIFCERGTCLVSPQASSVWSRSLWP